MTRKVESVMARRRNRATAQADSLSELPKRIARVSAEGSPSE